MDNLPFKLKRRVFLNYNFEDREIAKRIEERLRVSGFDVWFFEKEIFSGDSISSKVGKAIETSDYLFILLSKNSIKNHGINQNSTVIIWMK